MKNFKKKLKGYSLAELVLAIGIFAIISSMLIFLVVDATRTLENTRTRSKAAQLTEEIYTSLILVKSQAWYNIAKHTNEGLKHLEYSLGEYLILDGEIVQNGLTYSFTIEEVQRDTNGNIIQTGGANDPHTRLINIFISWIDRIGKVHSINPKMYVNDWNTHSIVYTTKTDFDTGIFTETMSQTVEDGEVRLLSMKYSDWCNPTLSLTQHDLTRSGVASALFTIGDYVYMGTGENASGDAFSKISVAGEPPVVTELGTYNGYKVYDVFGLNGYSLLATDNNSAELVVIDISSPTNIYTVFTTLDIPNPKTKQKFVYVYNNIGYLTNDNKITIFSLSDLQQGVPPTVLQTVSIGDANSVISDIYVDSNYIYVTTQAGISDFFILENKAPYSVLGQQDIGTMSVTSLFVSEDLNRAYVGTQNNVGNEFFILDISNKSTTYPIVKSYDLGGTSVKALVSADQRVMIGGIGGQEYAVYDITDEQNAFKCGGLEIDAGINMITLVKKNLTLYTYILTGNSNAELQIIKGGPGGGGPDGEGYVEAGDYLSEIHDSGFETSEYYVLSLDTDIPTGTSLQIQFRSSNDSTMAGSTWLGPDGTSNTSYQASGVFQLPTSLAGRYLQYKVIFNSDTVYTPLLKELIINYEK